MVDYAKAIKRPFTDFGKLVIGILLVIIPFVNVITLFCVYGYGLECAKTAIKKKTQLPGWDNVLKLFLQGVLMMIIAIVYTIPALIFLIIGGINSKDIILTSFRENTLNIGPSVFASITLFIIFLLLTLLAGYLLPVAMINYGFKRSFKKAFCLREVFKKAFTGKYFIHWIGLIAMLWVISSVLAGISIIWSLIPLIGGVISTILLVFAYFVFMIVIWFTIFGEVYGEIKQ